MRFDPEVTGNVPGLCHDDGGCALANASSPEFAVLRERAAHLRRLRTVDLEGRVGHKLIERLLAVAEGVLLAA